MVSQPACGSLHLVVQATDNNIGYANKNDNAWYCLYMETVHEYPFGCNNKCRRYPDFVQGHRRPRTDRNDLR